MEEWCPGISTLSLGSLRLVLEKKDSLDVSLKLWKEFGTLEIPRIQLLNEMGFIKEDLCSACVRAGNIPALEHFLKDASATNKLYTHNAAANGGQLETLKYLLRKGGVMDHYTSSTAAYGGHIHILEYLHECKCPFDEECSRIAAIYGHLPVLKFLHEKGYPFYEGICGSAMFTGQLECLKFLHGLGYSVTPRDLEMAKERGHQECIDYLSD